MRMIPYYDRIPMDPPDGCCVRLSAADGFEPLRGRTAVWLEAPDPRAAVAAARAVVRPVLNSLPADESAWQAIGAQALQAFAGVVLLPYRPGAAVQSYDENLEAALSLARRFGVPQAAVIVDVCIFPRRAVPDLAVYEARIARLRGLGLASCGGVNNYVFGDDERLLEDAWGRLETAGMDFGLVSARLAPIALGRA
ncbi:hypothetical protein [Paenibacillus sp.]|uniref:hypothetical protein n=1 Tax=Paenibacillus sp. TaxID=58172 RepID=UPI002D52C06E|nr:hypothetical protein [Paenibacillus sp.]HZG57142.1 hypothetical protein [Paenibacillus sp.]